MAASRAKGVVEQQKFQDLMQAHISQWSKDYASNNPDHLAAHYEGFLTAIIMETPRANLMPLKVAAMHKFGVSYQVAQQFAFAISTFVSSLRRKTGNCTSGKRQPPAMNRLISAYKLKWGDDSKSVVPDDHQEEAEVAPTTPGVSQAPSVVPSWGEFTKRFDKVVSMSSPPYHCHCFSCIF